MPTLRECINLSLVPCNPLYETMNYTRDMVAAIHLLAEQHRVKLFDRPIPLAYFDYN